MSLPDLPRWVEAHGIAADPASWAIAGAVGNARAKLIVVTGEADLEALRRGVTLNDGLTLPAKIERIDPPALWPRDPPVRFRKTVPDAWLALTIREGRNRQVRRMTAAVGLPTLRLVRVAIGEWRLEDLQPGEWRRLD